MNLFGEDFDVQEQENACAATASKPSKPKEELNTSCLFFEGRKQEYLARKAG